jgi:hypothetical protein
MSTRPQLRALLTLLQGMIDDLARLDQATPRPPVKVLPLRLALDDDDVIDGQRWSTARRVEMPATSWLNGEVSGDETIRRLFDR